MYKQIVYVYKEDYFCRPWFQYHLGHIFPETIFFNNSLCNSTTYTSLLLFGKTSVTQAY